MEHDMKRIHRKIWNESLPTGPHRHDRSAHARGLHRRFGTTLLVAGSLLTGDALANELLYGTTTPAKANAAAAHEAIAQSEPAPDGSHADGGGIARGRDATAIGYGAQALGSGTSAFGGQARADRQAASAFGGNARAAGTDSTAVGANAQALMATASAFGTSAQARASAAVAIGYDAKVREGAADGSAFGARSEVRAGNAVALGAGSIADRAGTVSIGRAGAARQLAQVAAGTEANDAVNRAQLDALSAKLDDASHYFRADGVHDGSDDAFAAGRGAIAIGRRSKAGIAGATAVGAASAAGGFDSTAIGHATEAPGGSSTAIGGGAQATGFGNIALGVHATADGEESAIAAGHLSAASGTGSIALGTVAEADGAQSLALGFFADGSGEDSVAIGANSLALRAFSIAAGSEAEAHGDEAIAIGRQSRAAGAGALAAGAASVADGTRSMALGHGAHAGQDYGTAIGAASYAHSLGATALGQGATAFGQQSTSLGYGSAAMGAGDLAVGSSTARGKDSNAIGAGNVVDTFYATALGSSSVIEHDSWNSVAMGHDVAILADSPSSIAIGTGARIASHATASMALGFLASAEGPQSLAIGGAGTTDYGDELPMRHPTTARALHATALGSAALAAADRATALGFGAYAPAVGAVALGARSIAERPDTISVGRFGYERQITHVASGTEDTDAVNLRQLRQSLGDGGGVIGKTVQYDDDGKATVTLKSASGTTLGNVRAGLVAKGSREAVNGGQLFEHADQLAQTLGGGSMMTRGGWRGPVYAIQGAHFYSVGDAFSAVDGKLGQLDYRVNRLEEDKGAGEQPMSRLRSSNGGVRVSSEIAKAPERHAAASSSAEPALAAAPVVDSHASRTAAASDTAKANQVEEALVTARHYADGTALQAANEARAYTDQRTAALVANTDFDAFKSDVNLRFHSLATRLNRVGAMGTALAGMAGAIAAATGTDNRVSAAVGGYRGQAALAIGFARRIPGNGAVLLGGSLAGSGESSGTLGVSFGW